MHRITLFIFAIAIFWGFHLPAQENNPKVDSLLSVVKNTKTDTVKVLALIDLCKYYQNIEPDSTIKYSKACISVAEVTGYTFGMAAGHIQMGIALMHKGNNKEALDEFTKSYDLYSNLGLKKGMANSLNNAGLVYSAMQVYDKALDYDLRAMKIYEESGNKMMQGNVLNNIGLVFINQLRYEDAFPYLKQSVSVMKNAGEELGLRNPYNNLGLVYRTRFNYDSSNYYYNLAIDLYKKANDDYNLASCYNNMALNYENLKDSTHAFYYNRLALEKRITMQDLPGVATSYLNIGVNYVSNHEPEKAKFFIRKAIHLGDSLRLHLVLQQAFMFSAFADSAMGRFDSAFYYYKLAAQQQDSLFSDEINQQLTDMKVKYDTDEISKQSAIKDEQLKKEATIRWLIIGIATLFLIGGILMLIAYRAIRKINRLLAIQKEEILQKNFSLNEKNNVIQLQKKEITDSIDYALLIQQALLPLEEEWKKLLPQSFVLSKPRDIVSGDFHYLSETENSILFSIADCTGHGVPGALMSMIGVEELNYATTLSSEPDKILSLINRSIKKVLRQSGDIAKSRDGMDIAVCQLKGLTLKYSGANRPLWIYSKGELSEYTATKSSIGGFTNDDQKFELHTIQLLPGDMIYLSSDGFADQFGGPQGKKFMSKNLKKSLIEISVLPIADQKNKLHELFINWKGKLEQVDDVCIIGIRV